MAANSLRQLSLRGALIHVRVPAADVRERDFEADIRLRQLRDPALAGGVRDDLQAARFSPDQAGSARLPAHAAL